MMFRVFGGLGQALDDRRGRGEIGITDTEVDDIDSPSEGLLFHLVDGCEQIGRQRLDAGCDFDRETGHTRELLC